MAAIGSRMSVCVNGPFFGGAKIAGQHAQIRIDPLDAPDDGVRHAGRAVEMRVREVEDAVSLEARG